MIAFIIQGKGKLEVVLADNIKIDTEKYLEIIVGNEIIKIRKNKILSQLTREEYEALQQEVSTVDWI